MWLNPQETTDFVTFTEEILNGKLHFLFSESNYVIKELRLFVLEKYKCIEKYLLRTLISFMFFCDYGEWDELAIFTHQFW